MTDTIFALSSGAPPAAIAIVRISGPAAGSTLANLCGELPEPRRAVLRTLRDRSAETLDEALVLWLPGPANATGEDCAELHCHGGRAVVAAVLAELARLPGLRAAEAGEFTRRAFTNGRLDLAQADALGDLLAAETELQRQVALAGVGGALSVQVTRWRDEVLALAASVEATLDFADEEDVAELPVAFFRRRGALAAEISAMLAQPRSERLRDGVRVVLAGPPNSGKSSLFNAIVGESAAIVAASPGTTRDVIERPVAIGAVPFLLVDTAGLRQEGIGAVEAMGIDRARAQMARADLVLWLGPEGAGPAAAIEVQSRCDDPAAMTKRSPDYVVSSVTGSGIAELLSGLVLRGRELLPRPSTATVNALQAGLLGEARDSLNESSPDPVMVAEGLRSTRASFDRLLGYAGVEEMLDVLFARFCIGK